jgi:hypothetical protein
MWEELKIAQSQTVKNNYLVFQDYPPLSLPSSFEVLGTSSWNSFWNLPTLWPESTRLFCFHFAFHWYTYSKSCISTVAIHPWIQLPTIYLSMLRKVLLLILACLGKMFYQPMAPKSPTDIMQFMKWISTYGPEIDGSWDGGDVYFWKTLWGTLRCISPRICSSFLNFYFLTVLGFEFRILHLLARHCTTWATYPALFCLVIFQVVSCVLPMVGLRP